MKTFKDMKSFKSQDKSKRSRLELTVIESMKNLSDKELYDIIHLAKQVEKSTGFEQAVIKNVEESGKNLVLNTSRLRSAQELIDSIDKRSQKGSQTVKKLSTEVRSMYNLLSSKGIKF